MKKNMIKLAAGAAAVLLLSTSAQAGYTMKKKIGDVDTKLTMFGFSQLEMRGGAGSLGGKSGEDTAVSFHAQRIRLGWKYSAGKVRAKVFLDFNKDSVVNSTDNVGLPDNIKDAFIAYNLHKAFIPKMGVIKSPHGMSFTMPGWNLDTVERGFDKKLVMERNMGLMISGRDIGFGNYGKVTGFEMGHERPWKGFGYDIMIANQAGRSAAVTNAQEGNGNAYTARLMFDWTELLHVEGSYALSEKAGGIAGQGTLTANTEDYESYAIGLDSSFLNGANVKAEYMDGHNIKGIKDYDEATISLSAQYAINNMFEPTIKHIQGSAKKGTNADTTDLGNTYFGVNIFLSPFDNKMTRSAKRNRNAHKVVLNYIYASGDTDGTWSGLGGYKADAWVMQWQVKF